MASTSEPVLSGTGLGLRFEGIEAALSYELIDVVGPRLQFQLGVTPSAF
jgi:hypothetical protein